MLATVALFSIGFLIRPLGAFLFGWVGDGVGRKYTFLITLSGMGALDGPDRADPDLRRRSASPRRCFCSSSA